MNGKKVGNKHKYFLNYLWENWKPNVIKPKPGTDFLHWDTSGGGSLKDTVPPPHLCKCCHSLCQLSLHLWQSLSFSQGLLQLLLSQFQSFLQLPVLIFTLHRFVASKCWGLKKWLVVRGWLNNIKLDHFMSNTCETSYLTKAITCKNHYTLCKSSKVSPKRSNSHPQN